MQTILSVKHRPVVIYFNCLLIGNWLHDNSSPEEHIAFVLNFIHFTMGDYADEYMILSGNKVESNEK